MLKYRKAKLAIVALLAIGLAGAPALTAQAQAAVPQAPAIASVPAVASVLTLAAVVPAPLYSYDMRFPIKSMPFDSPTQFFRKVRAGFVGLFPILGAKPLFLNAFMTLHPPGIPFPVYVRIIALDGWTFGTKIGHPDFPNGTISFRFTKVANVMHLNVHGFIPPSSIGGHCFANIACRFAYLSVAKSTWTKFAANLTRVPANVSNNF